jgi:hypothetical protein
VGVALAVQPCNHGHDDVKAKVDEFCDLVVNPLPTTILRATTFMPKSCPQKTGCRAQQKGRPTKQASGFQSQSPSLKCSDAQIGDHLIEQIS